MNKVLKRYPYRKGDTLQAWDSADELILQEMEREKPVGKRVLIINDSFGALSTSLEDLNPVVYTDSYVAAKGIEVNGEGRITCLNDLGILQGTFDYVLIKIPKNMSFFEDILCRVSGHIHQGTRLICGVMVKHLAASSFEILKKCIGTTSTGLAQKKARLVFAAVEKGSLSSPYPLKVKLDGFPREFINHSNLFSREKLDIGTRFFLEHLPKGPYQTILDLGCANGVIGIKAQELNPGACLFFSDESAMAIQSARMNYQTHFPDGKAHFHWTNCFEDGDPRSLDLILCNPPFHQQSTVGDFIAWQMFTDAHRALKRGGVLRVIGNSHLGYQHKLKKIFGNSKIIASNQKFMIIDAFQTA